MEFESVKFVQGIAIIEFVANLQFKATLASCLRRAVEGQLVRARRCSFFRTCTFFPVQNTYTFESCSYCTVYSSTCTAFRRARITSVMD